MTEKERDNFIQHDIEMRKTIIKEAVSIGLTSSKDIIANACKTIESIKSYFTEQYSNYSSRILTWDEKYKPSDFWFNDAGFQFKWRNFENIIQLECLNWNTVKKLVKETI